MFDRRVCPIQRGVGRAPKAWPCNTFCQSFSALRTLSASEVDWSLARSRGWLMLVVENNGARRLRLSDVKLMQGGEVIARRDGFVGYVLPGLTRQWRVGTEDSYSGGLVTLSANSQRKRIDASLASAVLGT